MREVRFQSPYRFSIKTDKKGGMALGKKTILLVEDEVGIRELIQMYLEDKGYEVITAKDGKRGLSFAESKDPDIILLDIEMPGMDGFEVCKEIRKKMTIPILFISCRKEVMDKIKCFELGGDDYLTKPFDFAELEARIQANLRRYKSYDHDSPSNIMKHGDLEIYLDSAKCYHRGELVVFPPKEMQLLILLAKHPDQIWSAEQLYDHIWGFDYVGNFNTVKVHISNLRRRLEEDPAKPKYI